MFSLSLSTFNTTRLEIFCIPVSCFFFVFFSRFDKPNTYFVEAIGYISSCSNKFHRPCLCSLVWYSMIISVCHRYQSLVENTSTLMRSSIHKDGLIAFAVGSRSDAFIFSPFCFRSILDSSFVCFSTRFQTHQS